MNRLLIALNIADYIVKHLIPNSHFVCDFDTDNSNIIACQLCDDFLKFRRKCTTTILLTHLLVDHHKEFAVFGKNNVLLKHSGDYPAWNYFEAKSNDTVTCKQCKVEYSNQNVFLLLIHLQRAHKSTNFKNFTNAVLAEAADVTWNVEGLTKHEPDPEVDEDHFSAIVDDKSEILRVLGNTTTYTSADSPSELNTVDFPLPAASNPSPPETPFNFVDMGLAAAIKTEPDVYSTSVNLPTPSTASHSPRGQSTTPSEASEVGLTAARNRIPPRKQHLSRSLLDLRAVTARMSGKWKLVKRMKPSAFNRPAGFDGYISYVTNGIRKRYWKCHQCSYRILAVNNHSKLKLFECGHHNHNLSEEPSPSSSESS